MPQDCAPDKEGVFMAKSSDNFDDRNNNMDNHQTKRVPIHREGVSYIPSSAGHSPDDLSSTRKIMTSTSAAGRKPSDKAKTGGGVKKYKKSPPPKKAPKKTHYAVFLVTTVFVCALAAVFTFALLFSEIFSEDSSGNGPSLAQASPPPTDPTPPPAADPAPADAAIGLIQEISHTSQRIDIYVFESSQRRSFFAESHSVLRDKFGNPITFGQFNTGDVVEIVYSGTAIDDARLSPQVLTYHNIHDVVVDTESQVILIGNRRYSYSAQTIVMYHGQQVGIEDIDPVDIVSIDVFRSLDLVVFIDIHQGNGVINIPEESRIIQGIVEVGNIFTALDEDGMEIRVPEGQRRVVVRGANIEPFEFEVTVTRGGNAHINFDDLVLLSGSLTVFVEDPYATLRIDGEYQLTNEVIMLDYGTYSISVTREGFIPFEAEVTIDSANHEITVSLEQFIQTRNVVINSSPQGARVYLDDEYMGVSPVSVELQFRRYTVTLALEGFIGVSPDIWVTDTSPAVHTFVLIPDPNHQTGGFNWGQFNQDNGEYDDDNGDDYFE